MLKMYGLLLLLSSRLISILCCMAGKGGGPVQHDYFYFPTVIVLPGRGMGTCRERVRKIY